MILKTRYGCFYTVFLWVLPSLFPPSQQRKQAHMKGWSYQTRLSYRSPLLWTRLYSDELCPKAVSGSKRHHISRCLSVLEVQKIKNHGLPYQNNVFLFVWLFRKVGCSCGIIGASWPLSSLPRFTLLSLESRILQL